MKTFSVVGAGFVIFLLWVMIASTPTKRIERTCQPVLWVGNIAESVALLFGSNSGKNSVTNSFESADYACRYSVWRLFYGKEYEEKMKKKKSSSGSITGFKENEDQEAVDDGVVM